MFSTEKKDLVIIGGGAGGLVVASVASQLGLNVVLIEKEKKMGGDCLHYGCVPSKTLIRSAKVASLMRRAQEFGLPIVEFDVDIVKINERVQSVIDKIQPHDDPERFRDYGCEVLMGEAAKFVDTRSVRVGDRVIRGRRFVIATGSRPFIPPIDGLEQVGYLTNLDIFTLRQLPPRLVVLGGGPIGLEMAQAFSRLGSQVTVVEMLPHLLPQEDPEVSDALRAVLEQEGITIHTSTCAERVRREDDKRIVECSNNVTVHADQILVAVGRRANVDNLGLQAAGIEYSERGIQVDAGVRKTWKCIHEGGDVGGVYLVTDMAGYRAAIIMSNAGYRVPLKWDYRVDPGVN